MESLFHRRLESAYLDLVIAFERFCNQMNWFLFYRHRLPELRPTSNGKPMLNPFQKTYVDPSTMRQFTAREWFQQTHKVDIFAATNPPHIDELWLIFQKRHLLQHQGGIVDQIYLDKTNDSSAVVGTSVHISRTEINHAIGTVQGMIHSLKSQLT